MKVQFTKYHGLGNDFIIVEDGKGILLPQGEMLARALCHRQIGIGADGLVLITQTSDLYTMRIFNPDGTEPEMCGNAIRCMADYLVKEGLVEGPIIHVGTLSGVKEISILGDHYVVDMGEPDFSFGQGEGVEISLSGLTWTAYPVSMGNPHAVVFVDDLEALDLFRWGPRLEGAEVWPHGANIEFTQVLNSQHLQVRVWERGAGPTLACGTGACAAAVVAARQGLTRNFGAGGTLVSLPGGDLTIRVGPTNRVLMIGPAQKVFTGQIDVSRVERESRL
ncbi:MAG TPA: diaminopimelate epimerase [Firmicutes bacterium]|nr:diaminopimelate epimerase [Bacillota bacterium]